MPETASRPSPPDGARRRRWVWWTLGLTFAGSLVVLAALLFWAPPMTRALAATLDVQVLAERAALAGRAGDWEECIGICEALIEQDGRDCGTLDAAVAVRAGSFQICVALLDKATKGRADPAASRLAAQARQIYGGLEGREPANRPGVIAAYRILVAYEERAAPEGGR